MAEQNNSEAKCKVIITVKPNVVSVVGFRNYKPFSEGCYEVYKFLLKHYDSNFESEKFINFLKALSFKDEAGEESPVLPNFAGLKDINIFESDLFINWIDEEVNKRSFLSQLSETNVNHLIRKHCSDEIYVAPVLNEDFTPENIDYLETLVNSLINPGENAYLLLHDKDIYEQAHHCHNASNNDFFGIKDWSSFSSIRGLIEKGNVFVFQHDVAIDNYYNNIVSKLDTLSAKDILNALKKKINNPNYELSERLASSVMPKSEIARLLALEKLALKNKQYDFTNGFLDLEDNLAE